MQLNPAEISELIKGRIEGLAVTADIKNQGTVVSVTDGIVRVHGLSDVMAGEMLGRPFDALWRGLRGQPAIEFGERLRRFRGGDRVGEAHAINSNGSVLLPVLSMETMPARTTKSPKRSSSIRSAT